MILIVMFLFLCSGLQAQETAEEKAKAFASDFLLSRKVIKKSTDYSVALREVYQSPDTTVNKLFGFQDASAGFVLLAKQGDDFLVTAYSENGIFDTTYLDRGVNSLVRYYENAILPGTDSKTGGVYGILQSTGIKSWDADRISPVKDIKSSDTLTKTNRELQSFEIQVDPLLEAEPVKWGQDGYFNVRCPYDEGAATYTKVGCVAVSMGQIMRYHRYPESGTGSHSYTHSKYGDLNADFGNTVYLWNEMPGVVTEPNEYIAELLYHCGVASEMNYGVSESGTYLSDALGAFRSFFGYHDAELISHSQFSHNIDQYYDIIRDEIDMNRPVLYELNGDPGHTVVADGYNGNYFHLNFGWSGRCDGYYLLEGVQYIDNYNLHMKGNAIIGLNPGRIPVNHQDSLALVAIYDNTDGHQWARNEGWLTDAPLSQWQGVTAAGGRILGLDLSQNRLSGTIPAEIGNLTSLVSLDLSYNSLEGNIPKEIGSLENLASLEIKSAKLTGAIPEEIIYLTRLHTLDLSGNQLEGNIPTGIYDLTDLRVLSLAANNLTGGIHPQIGQLDKLTYFSLWKNQLSGELPPEIGNLVNIREFIISENQFAGTLPSTIGAWVNLTNFSISDNALEGEMPDAVSGFTKLRDLKISNNRFTALPENIGNLAELRSIEADNNLLETIPVSVSQLQNLYGLNLMNNKIRDLPDLGEMPALWYLRLTDNLIEFVPESIGKMGRLSELYFSGNNISELPSSIERLTRLRVLALNRNRLTTVPVSLCFLGKLKQLFLSDNNISGPLPPLGHLSLDYIDIKNNSFVFSDIAASLLPDQTIHTGDYTFDYHNQAIVSLSDSLFLFAPGDSSGIDIRSVTKLTHPENQYEWFKNDQLVQTGPYLYFSDFSEDNEGVYYCRVKNTVYSKLLVLETGPLTIKSGRDAFYDNGFLVTSRSSQTSQYTDNTVMLVAPADIRGEIVWQASADSVDWYDISEAADHDGIRENIISIEENKIFTEPVTPAYYRYMILEDTCDPVFSDVVKINSYGDMLVDTLINVTDKEITIAVDSIEIIIPPQFSDEDFRLTVKKLQNPPDSPDHAILGSVYDVEVSFGNIFELPLLIRLKNIDKESFDPEYIDNYKAVYFDDTSQEWVPFEKGNISLKDSTIVFETMHLTKLSWWRDKEAIWGYTDVFVSNNVRVFYKDNDRSFFDYIYGRNQTVRDWHRPASDPEFDTPFLIQDIAHFLHEVMDKFEHEGLPVPSHNFTVYVKEMDDYGNIGMMGLLNHYMNINRDIETPEQMRSLVAHEFMHYTQDNYITAHAGNIFWMEAHAHLADRMVWDDTILPVSESDSYVLNGRSGDNTIFEFLATSWDHWDKSVVTQNRWGNVYFGYLAGTFLHYMRSYKSVKMLDPALLLKETPSLQSWKNYLDSYIKSNLGSNIGDQYEDYVRYMIEGANPNFTLLERQEGEDPLKYFKTASSEFMTNRYIRFDNDREDRTIKDTVSLQMPYLSTQMVQMYNLNTDNQKVLVRYKRRSLRDENIKVYLCRYEHTSGNMVLDDISPVDSAWFLIDSPTETHVLEKKHVAYLLFINKDKDREIGVNYDLEYVPVPEFSFMNAFGFTIGNSLSEAEIHVFNDGTNDITGRFHVMPGVFRTYADEYYSPLSYDVQVTDEVIVANASSDHIDQTITYNFVTGDMAIYNRENWGGYSENASIDIREITLNLKNVRLKPLEAGSDKMFVFSTSVTEQTLEVIENISYTREHATWNYQDNQHNPVVTTTYLRTLYDSDDIRFYLNFY